MFIVPGNTETTKTTSYKVVLPFYIYGALAFFIATLFLLFYNGGFDTHYFNPQLLSITHIMALGWGTMIILGASHQLVPVLIEGKLYSEKLGYASFILAATGIPFLIYGFYFFDMGAPAKWGGRLVILSILLYLINLGVSISKSKKENIHAIYIFTSVIWLLLTASLGLALVYNFTYDLIPHDSIHYLPLHAHTGIVGWFLLLIMGVGSRLIPMFLISKYTNTGLLWIIFLLINGSLIFYTLEFYFFNSEKITLIPVLAILTAVVLFVFYCYKAYKARLRRQLDPQMKLSFLSVFMILIPVVMLITIIVLLMSVSRENIKLIVTYGFVIFFGWITAIILGMTFKTLPFIVWNKVYHLRSGSGKTISPKDLFSNFIFKLMTIAYLSGFILFVCGILSGISLILKSGSILLIFASFFYTWNVVKIVSHKPAKT